ncbi:MAG: YgfZ/GcvT domain-containing protein [Burkholderiaceae bacterium]
MLDSLPSSAEATMLIPLPELGIIAVTGADAVSFLQSQLTNDVTRLRPDQMQLTGYCTPKGRLLATFHQWRADDTIFLRAPRELVPSLVKRLSMFVLRAKAKVSDVSDQWLTYGLLGPVDIAADGLRVDRVLPTPTGKERFLLTAPVGSPLPAANIAQAQADRWWLSEIEAAVPTVFAATQERFVPQMINFEVLGGVDFKKGCYPGQEVVARSQYRGKLKRRMNIAHVDATGVQAAADVFASGSEQPVGTVVVAAPSDNGSELLFEAPVDQVESGSLHLQSSDGPQLTLRPLPYTLFDPTE